MKYALAAAFVLATMTTASAQYQTRPYGQGTYGGLDSYGGLGNTGRLGNSGSLGNTGNLGGYGTGSNPNSHYVQPRYNSGGTTQGYYRTNPNSDQTDNYGARGNYNSNNGSYGTRTPRW